MKGSLPTTVHSARSAARELVNQPIEFIKRTEPDSKLARFLKPPRPFDTLLDPHLDLGG